MHAKAANYLICGGYATLGLLFMLGQWLRYWVEPRKALICISEWHMEFVAGLAEAMMEDETDEDR